MNTVTLCETTLTIEPQGLGTMWSFTKRLEIPPAHVRGATWDPGANLGGKGLRGPRLGLPGNLTAPNPRQLVDHINAAVDS